MQLYQLSLALLAPVLLLQGRKVRRTALQLPEASGKRIRTFGSSSCQPINILIIGDSAAAGVGVDTQSQALSGQLYHHLHQHIAARIEVIAASGETTPACLARLQQSDPGPQDVVITSLGVNDVTGSGSVNQWLQAQANLHHYLTTKLHCSLLIVSAIPPMQRFWLLPQPLRWYLASRAQHFNQKLFAQTQSNPATRFVNLQDDSADLPLAADGFHPSAAVYQHWAAHCAGLILQHTAQHERRHFD